MTYAEIIKAAESDRRIDDMRPEAHEELLWYRWREWLRHRRAAVSDPNKMEARREKIFLDFQRQEANAVYARKIIIERARMWGLLDELMSEYALEPSMELADRMYEAIYNISAARPEKEEQNERNQRTA